jgi:hypothetical protein
LSTICKMLFISLISLTAVTGHAVVWDTLAAWDDEQDAAFTQWIETLTMNIFTDKASPYYGVATDCGEAAYVLRAIFAYQNGLPIDFVGDQAGDLNNSSTRFDSVNDGDERFLAFVKYLKGHVNTETLVNDSYPIAINRNFLKAGALFLHPKSSNPKVSVTFRDGHVYYVQGVMPNGMIRYFSSTVPARARQLQQRIDITFMPFETTGGYRAWNRPGNPGESAEQFHMGGWRANDFRDQDGLWETWQAAIHQRLAQRPATINEKFNAKLFNVEGYVRERDELVRLSWALYQNKYHGNACMNAQDYDDYSTPARDVKIQSELEDLKTATQAYLTSIGRAASDQNVSGIFAQYSFSVAGQTVNLNQIWTTFETSVVLAISEPEHSPQVRWGLETQAHWPCPERAKNYVGGESISTN